MQTNFPKDIMIEVTNICNLRCTTCYSHQDSREKDYMKFNTFKKIIDEIPNKKNKTISLYNYWEPLLHKKIWEFISYAKQNQIKNIKIATNWTHLTTEKSLELIKAWLDYISISVDWTTQKIYEQFRKWWNLNTVLTNIKKLVNLKQKLWTWPIIELQFIIMSHNEHQVTSIEKLAKNLWVDILRYKTVLIKEIKWKHLIPNEKGYSRYKKTNKNYCNKPKEWIVINFDWTVIPCCYITDKQIEKYSIWNVNDDNLEKLFYSEKSQDFVRKVEEDKSKIEYCKGCDEGNLDLDYRVVNF